MMRKDRLAMMLAGLGIAVAGAVAPFSWGQETPGATPLGQPAMADATASAITAYRQAAILFDQGKYAEAQTQVDAAIALDPELPDARLLKNRIEAELVRLGRGGGLAAQQQFNSPADQLVTQEQINRIRMFEITEGELKAARGVIAPADLEDFWKNVILKDPAQTAISTQDKAHFMATANLAGQMAKIRDERALTYYDKVRLTTEPASLRVFRTRIQTYILPNCATSGCHGGDGAIAFRLYGNPNALIPPTERETYTNFVVFSMIAAGGHGFVDRADPDQSLVIQYLLPRKDAVQLHPKVNDREIDTHRLTGTADARYREMVEWIKSLAYPQPRYELEYKIVAKPGPSAATAPATGTAMKPAMPAASRPR